MTTVFDVAADVRNRTDQNNSQEVSDAVLITWINSAQLALYDAIIELGVYNCTQLAFTLTTASTVDLEGHVGTPLPADFYKVWRLSQQYNGPSQWRQVTCVHQSQLDNTGFPAFMTGGLPFGPQVGYFVVPPNLLVVPAGSASANYVLSYYPTMPALTSLTDPIYPLFDGSGWWEYISLDACCAVFDRLKQDTSPYLQRKGEVLARVQRSAANRDVTYGTRLDPNRGRQRGWGGLMGGGGIGSQ